MKKTWLLLVLLLSAFPGCRKTNEELTVTFSALSGEKSWSIKELNWKFPTDWSEEKYLTFEFRSSTNQRFSVNLHDRGGIRKLEIVPFQGVWVRASLPLKHYKKMNTEGMDQASIWKTPRPGYWIGFTGQVGPLTGIDSLGIEMPLPIGTQTLELRNFSLTDTPMDTVFTGKPLVDEFGRWVAGDMLGKTITPEQLKARWAQEDSTLGMTMTGRSSFGGFEDQRYKATGFFRTMKIDKVWWLIDPQGYRFFSHGSCCISPGSDLARIKGREYIFAALPPMTARKDDNEEHGDHHMSFYTWNLTRRFGDDWYGKWIELTSARMKSWGLNTVGNWSDLNAGIEGKTAYVANLSGWGIETGYMGMPDVYAPGYQEMVDSAASSQCDRLRNDPYLLGYFIGNEPAWPGRENDLAETILLGEETPMKTALVKYLADGDTPDKRRSFAYETFARFLSAVCSSVRKYDPNHLNLGLRFGYPPTDELITLCGKYFDVFSMNHYGYSLDNQILDNISNLTGLPLIIGEFHFGIPGKGLAPGLAQVKDPEERTAAYIYYVENAAANPSVVGTHWFQWIDQPVTGRFDGENYNIGIVDVTDMPYPEMLKATRETFRRLPDVHSGKIPPSTRKALPL